jgi:hypothetical protein
VPDRGKPYFFFSYSRSDAIDRRVEGFLTKLNTQVALLAGCGGETLYYRDTSARLPDGRWQEPLLKALKEECNVLLALYTPGYFRQKANEKCYCGRELSLFLRRTGGVHVNIIPVLWLIDNPPPEEWVPPPLRRLDWYICRDEDCAIPQKRIQQYERKGLQSVWVNGRSSDRDNIIDDLARRILGWSRTPPPALTSPVDMDSEDCAFHPGEAARRALPTAGDDMTVRAADSRALTLVYLDEGQVPDSAQDLIERAGRDLGNFVDSRRWSVNDGVEALRRAAERNSAVVLVAKASALTTGAARAAIEDFIRRGDCIAGVLQLDGDAGLTSTPSVPVRSAPSTGQELPQHLSALTAEIRNALVRFATPVTPPSLSRRLPRL